MALRSSVYLNPASGVIEKARPNNRWREVHGAGVLMRIVEENGEWAAQRIHPFKRLEMSEQGWEAVTWSKVPTPVAWVTGTRSQIRFGFCALAPGEQVSLGRQGGVAIVLPDVPGREAPANCPGARYMFQLGMVTGGVPADYLVEKLLSFRLCSIGMARSVGVWVATGAVSAMRPPGHGCGPAHWEKAAVAKLMDLASALSDDLAEASRREFGDTDDCSSWSRRRQWQALKARRADGAPG